MSLFGINSIDTWAANETTIVATVCVQSICWFISLSLFIIRVKQVVIQQTRKINKKTTTKKHKHKHNHNNVDDNNVNDNQTKYRNNNNNNHRNSDTTKTCFQICINGNNDTINNLAHLMLIYCPLLAMFLNVTYISGHLWNYIHFFSSEKSTVFQCEFWFSFLVSSLWFGRVFLYQFLLIRSLVLFAHSVVYQISHTFIFVFLFLHFSSTVVCISIVLSDFTPLLFESGFCFRTIGELGVVFSTFWWWMDFIFSMIVWFVFWYKSKQIQKYLFHKFNAYTITAAAVAASATSATNTQGKAITTPTQTPTLTLTTTASTATATATATNSSPRSSSTLMVLLKNTPPKNMATQAKKNKDMRMMTDKEWRVYDEFRKQNFLGILTVIGSMIVFWCTQLLSVLLGVSLALDATVNSVLLFLFFGANQKYYELLCCRLPKKHKFKNRQKKQKYKKKKTKKPKKPKKPKKIRDLDLVIKQSVLVANRSGSDVVSQIMAEVDIAIAKPEDSMRELTNENGNGDENESETEMAEMSDTTYYGKSVTSGTALSISTATAKILS